MSDFLKSHRAHHYPTLAKRWKAVARASRLQMEKFATVAGYDLFSLKSPALKPENGIYISAGIHGDEPAGAEALITWAEGMGNKLKDIPLLMFPCLNPWGITNNSRLDHRGRDLNRLFNRNTDPLVRKINSIIHPYHFALSLTLHEDYDGQGLYIYEISRGKNCWGEDLLSLARKYIPIEGRTMIDGRKAASGLIRRRINAKHLSLIPAEAVYLHIHKSEHTFTFETPSEYGLEERVKTQVALIDECVKRIQTNRYE